MKGDDTVAYTPTMSEKASATLRRIAWAMGKPMTVTLNMIFERLPSIMDLKKVCECCQDPSKCKNCGFADRIR